MNIERLLANLVNRVIIYILIEAFIQVILTMAKASGSAGIVVGAVTIAGFVVVELLNGARWAKGQG